MRSFYVSAHKMIVFLVFKINLNNRLQIIILNFMQERDYNDILCGKILL